jgi:hypothetical protein
VHISPQHSRLGGRCPRLCVGCHVTTGACVRARTHTLAVPTRLIKSAKTTCVALRKSLVHAVGRLLRRSSATLLASFACCAVRRLQQHCQLQLTPRYRCQRGVRTAVCERNINWCLDHSSSQYATRASLLAPHETRVVLVPHSGPFDQQHDVIVVFGVNNTCLSTIPLLQSAMTPISKAHPHVRLVA